MSLRFPGWSAAEDEIEATVRSLSREVSALSHALARQGGRRVDEAREGLADVASDLSERVAELLPVVRRRGAQASHAAREHPAAVAVAGVVVAGLVLSILFRRRS